MHASRRATRPPVSQPGYAGIGDVEVAGGVSCQPEQIGVGLSGLVGTDRSAEYMTLMLPPAQNGQ